MKKAITTLAVAVSLIAQTAHHLNAATSNLIINGGAERGWYDIGKVTPRGIGASTGTDPIAPEVCGEWSIDEDEFRFGKRSFKGVLSIPGNGHYSGMYFNYIRARKGAPYSFSAWLKADRPAKVSLAFFVASGSAYGKEFAVTKEWKEYSFNIPQYGQEAPGVKMLGDVAGHDSSYLFTPRIDFGGPGTVWIDGVQVNEDAPYSYEDTSSLWIRVRLNKKEGYYFTGETVDAAVKVENSTTQTRETSFYYTVNDYFGREISKSPPENILIPANGIVTKKITCIPGFKGAGNVRFFARDNTTGTLYDHNVFLGVIDPINEAISSAAFGMNIVGMSKVDELIPYFKAFGIGSVRIWSAYSKKRDCLAGLELLPALKKAGMTVLFCISDLSPKVPVWYLAPKDMSEWSAYIREIARKNVGMVDYYEILNEPNIWGGRGPNPDSTNFEYMSVDGYVRIIKNTHEAIKSVDPAVKMAGPTSCRTDLSYLTSIMAAGSRYIDALTEHPYRELPEAPDYADDQANVDALLKKYGKNIEKMATEDGWVYNSVLPDNLISDTERRSDVMNIRLQIIGFASGLSKYFHFAAGLQPVGTDWKSFLLGNPDNDFTCIPNTYMFALRNLRDRIGGAVPRGAINLGSGVRCYVFERKAERIIAFWKSDEDAPNGTLSLPLKPSEFQAYDITGNPIRPAPAGGGCLFDLTGSPIYISTTAVYDDIVKAFSSADIVGMGDPFVTSVVPVTERSFTVTVRNKGMKPISGTIEILGKDIVAPNSSLVSFRDIPRGKSESLLFQALAPIGIAPQRIKIRTVLDDHETFDVNRFNLAAMIVRKVSGAITVDGDISDWRDITPIQLTIKNAVRSKEEIWTEADASISAKVFWTWDESALYAAIAVDKPAHYQDENELARLYNGDSLQIAFDPLKNGDSAVKNYGDDDFEYGIALTKQGTEVYRYRASAVKYDGFLKTMGKISDGDVTARAKKSATGIVYEIAFSRQSISPFNPSLGASMRANIIINLNNGKGRMGWIELSPGIGQYKSPGEFIDLILVK